MAMLGAWVASWGHVGILGSCFYGGTMLIQVATRDHSDIQAWAAAQDYVWVHGPVTVGIRVDIHGHQETTQMHGVWATTCSHEDVLEPW